MKMIHEITHHKLHHHIISGLVVGSILLLISLVDLMVLEPPIFQGKTVYLVMVPGICILLRCMRPSIGLLRAVFLITGSVLAGAVPMLLTYEHSQFLWTALTAGLLGAAMLGFGFSVNPEKI